MSGWQHLVSPYWLGLSLIQFDALKVQKILKQVCMPCSIYQLANTILKNCNAIVFCRRVLALHYPGENTGMPLCRPV